MSSLEFCSSAALTFLRLMMNILPPSYAPRGRAAVLTPPPPSCRRRRPARTDTSQLEALAVQIERGDLSGVNLDLLVTEMAVQTAMLHQDRCTKNHYYHRSRAGLWTVVPYDMKVRTLSFPAACLLPAQGLQSALRGDKGAFLQICLAKDDLLRCHHRRFVRQPQDTFATDNRGDGRNCAKEGNPCSNQGTYCILSCAQPAQQRQKSSLRKMLL